MTEDPHGMTGKRNAAKEITKKPFSFRMTPQQRAKLETLAEKADMKLGDYINHLIEKEAQK